MTTITDYSPSDHAELLKLLLVLHSSYFTENAPQRYQELRKEKSIKSSYENYLSGIEQNDDGTWRVFVAKDE